MAQFYSNENFPLQVVEALRELGHDVLTSLDTGNANARVADSDVLAYATSLNRAVLTLNRRDFIALHATAPLHDGIIVCTVDRDYAGQANRINDSVQGCSSLRGQLLRVHRPNK